MKRAALALLAAVGLVAGLVFAQSAPTASSGGGSGTVTSVSGTAPISVSSGTTTPAITFDTAVPGAHSFTGQAQFDAGTFVYGTLSSTLNDAGIAVQVLTASRIATNTGGTNYLTDNGSNLQFAGYSSFSIPTSATLFLDGAATASFTSNAVRIAVSVPLQYKSATSITAFAGGGQGSATALTAETNFVTTVGTAADSVKLITSALGSHQVVFNAGANSVRIFPQSGGAIDALGTNAGYDLAAGSSREFWGQSSTQWRSQ